MSEVGFITILVLFDSDNACLRESIEALVVGEKLRSIWNVREEAISW
jgi:hypothetical protein